ncbi:MAG: DNA polymerase III subunit alpha [Gammaproteobacteria bacterium]|nr:DNA polymerase III subunit alpha [Gammaproteobacteria bacterium]
MDPRFIHLRLHSEYSLIDGIVKIKPMIAEAVKLGMPAIGLTDQGNLFGTVKFYQAALQAGVKPIIGADIWLFNELDPKNPFRMTLFCQNNQGYKNLLQLLSLGFLEGQLHEKPQIKRDWISTHAAGLLALSGAHYGDIGQALLANDTDRTEELVQFWQALFPERYYLELQRTGQAQSENYLQAALSLAETHKLPLVATNDVRFLFKDDFDAHEARVCIHDGCTLADPRRTRAYTENQYFRTPEEMVELFADIPSALENTVEIAKRCNVTLQLGKSYLPQLPVPEGFTTETYLGAVAQEGLEERLKISFDTTSPTFATQRHAYDLRLQAEIDVINKMGFPGYFLIVADFIRWARQNDVPVGPGRGSGPGSLVAYALKITDLDPLEHELLFERFLNPERVSMPDFDIDFCMEGRDRVIDYVMRTHGHESVSQIITYGSMAAKAVVRDVGRVLGMSYTFVDKLAKLIPFEIGITLDKALEQEAVLRDRYEKEDDVRTLLDLALKLEGTVRNVGKHAGGVVIAPGKLTDFSPLYCEAGQSDHIVTQFDKDDVEAVGLVKFDFLGLRTLTIIDWAVKNINKIRKAINEAPIDIHLLPMNDAKTFTLLKACKTTAVFQLESRGMKDLVKRLQPDCFEDIVALVALFRPGPLQSGMVDDFINRKHGRSKVIYPHPKLEPILRPTYGVIVYQEQVMQIAQSLAGYSLGAADLLRRAMGKKKPEEMAAQRELFCKGSVERGVELENATYIFDLMEKFAGYGFNKSHSAAYALIAYQTAWLKAHYTAAYMAAVLSSDMDHTDKVVNFIDECKSLSLHVAPPNINHSEYMFIVLDSTHLAYGLGAVKGAGQAAIEAIILEREQRGKFLDLFDFCRRVDMRKMNKRVLEALIKAGAFDTIGPHRASIMASLPLALQQAEQDLRNQTLGQHDLFGNANPETPDMKYVGAKPWSDQERLFNERETLGLYLTGHPIHRFAQELPHFTTSCIADLRPTGQKKSVTVAGIISGLRSIQTKRGDRMAIVSIEDGSGQIDILCFAEIYNLYRELLIKDQVIIVDGEVSIDEFNDSYRMTCKDIFSIDQARARHAKYLKICLPKQQADSLEKLAAVLEKFSGGRCHVVIDYFRDDAAATLKLNEKWCIHPTELLIQTLRDMFTNTRVEMVY